ncbi:Methylenomycin A resistance protein [Streptomyces murinus]|uniref:DHA2 family efflux MFS transporter permease subunit n=1 Tax=Streptomyces murinus TaxID=33900 RepID=UPI003D673517
MSSTVSTDSEEEVRPSARSAPAILVFSSVAVGFVMAALDATVVNVAGASIEHSLHLGVSSLTWVIDGYMLAFASLLLLAGSIGSRFGAKKVYLVGLAGFTAASLACALAPTGDALVAARAVQGVAASLFLPGSLVLLVHAFPDPGKRARMVALWSGAGAAASGLGPVVGGVLVGLLGWRSVFVINVPIGIVGLLLTARLIKHVPTNTGNTLKITGHALSVLALVGLAFALIEGPSRGWSDPAVLIGAAGAVVFGTVFVLREVRGPAPVFPVQLFRDSQFSVANLVGFLLNFGLYGVLYMLGLFLQQQHHASPMRAGFQMLPMMIVFVIGNLTVARFVTKVGTRLPMLVGLSVAAVLSVVLAALTSQPYWLLAAVVSVANLGLGVTAPAMTAALMEAAGREHASVGSATFNANRQIGTLVGVAVTGTVLASVHDWATAARTTFAVAGVAYAIAALLVLRWARRPADEGAAAS